MTKRLDTASITHRLLPELPLPHKDYRTQLIRSDPHPYCDTGRIYPPAGQRQTCRGAILFSLFALGLLVYLHMRPYAYPGLTLSIL
ncbi:MAG TPA: hypothetical protein VMW53_11990 [archaeon]|nr:hypothetical protein [archaeon]